MPSRPPCSAVDLWVPAALSLLPTTLIQANFPRLQPGAQLVRSRTAPGERPEKTALVDIERLGIDIADPHRRPHAPIFLGPTHVDAYFTGLRPHVFVAVDVLDRQRTGGHVHV